MVESMRGWLAAAVAVLAALPAVAAPAPGHLPPQVLAIGATTAVPSVPWKGFDSNPPKLYDLDGDGDLELLAENDNNWLYVFDTRTGGLLAEAQTTVPKGWTPRTFNGPEAAVLEPGQAPRVVVANSAAMLTVFLYDAAHSTRHHLALVKEWERKLDDCHQGSGMDSKPVLADLDHDGDLDILASTEDFGVFALRADGSELWKTCIVGGNAEPAVGDLDLDGWEEVVFGSDLGMVNVLDGRTGETKWQFDLTERFDLSSGSVPNAITLGQVDGKGGPDLLLGARDSHDPLDWSNDHALLAAISSEGKLLWGRQDPRGNPLTYTHPLLVDADGDGEQEIYWGDWNTVGHYPPFEESKMWALTGPAHVYRYDLSGRMVWRQTLPTWWSNKDLTLLDADGDGDQELLANGPSAVGNHDGVWLLDPKTGAKEDFIDLYPWKLGRAPVADDLYGTGTLQFVVEAAQHASTSWGPAFLVYDTQASTPPAWPHAPYVTLDGAKPAAATGHETTTESPPPPAAPAPAATPRPDGFTLEGLRALRRFSAVTTLPAKDALAGSPPPAPQGPLHLTFAVQPLAPLGLQVVPRAADGRAIARVELRADGGPWQPMGRTAWDTWAALPMPGERLELRATALDGAQAQSAPAAWPLAATTLRSADAFAASFAPKQGPAAEWWVETRVEATAPVAAVAVRVAGGPAVALEPTAWGTWARSLHAPPGAPLEFTATAEDGQLVRWSQA
jgi:outer membrane protein assembly factor BamB